jgi:cytochrome c553
MRHRRRIGMVAAGLLWAGGAGAAEPDAGPEKAQLCATCHGPKGIATMPMTPHLAGQPAGYLSEQLRAYRSGKRQHEIMSLIAKPLSDDDITNLAAWYASLRVEVIDKP